MLDKLLKSFPLWFLRETLFGTLFAWSRLPAKTQAEYTKRPLITMTAMYMKKGIMGCPLLDAHEEGLIDC